MTTQDATIHPIVDRAFDALLKVHRPLVEKNLVVLQERHPDDTPADLLKRVERQYLNLATGTGAAIGAAAIVPGIGTGASLALSATGTIAFLESSALYGQTVARVHGITVDEPERARLLLMNLLLGSAGIDLVKQLAGQFLGNGPSQQVFWGQVITQQLPSSAVGKVSRELQRKVAKKVAKEQSTNLFGRILPFGVGAVIGGTGNRLLAKKVVQGGRGAFGPAPHAKPVPQLVTVEA